MILRYHFSLSQSQQIRITDSSLTFVSLLGSILKQALLKAWNSACADKRMATLLIPSGKNFLISRATSFNGPCKSAISVQIDGNIMAPNKIWTNKAVNFISFNNINNLFVYGQGMINGQGAIWWNCFRKYISFNFSYVRSCQLLNFENCNNLDVRYIKLRNGPRRHLAFHSCTNITVDQITVTAPGNSPNTDGINISNSQHIEITGSTFATGDDCIAISSGTSDVNITKITCGPGHGISIGSLGKGGVGAAVDKVHVFDCNIFNTMTGVRIKTWQGGSGFVRDVSFERINVTQVGAPIDINQFYTDAPQEHAVAISNVKFIGIHGISAKKTAIKIDCSGTVPCTGLFFDDINLARFGGNRTVLASTKNAHGTTKGKIIPPIKLLGNYEGQ
ncbi:polygalacturonase-2-like [Carex rostrata]